MCDVLKGNTKNNVQKQLIDMCMYNYNNQLFATFVLNDLYVRFIRYT